MSSPLLPRVDANTMGWIDPDGVTALDGRDWGELPIELTATTVNEYVVPFERPRNAADLADPPTVTVVPPGVAVATYEVIALPPLLPAVHETVADAFPEIAVTPLGAAGGPAGTTAAENPDGVPSPIAFVAATRNR